MAGHTKTQTLNDVYTLLKRRYKPKPSHERLSVLEAVIVGLCQEGTTREHANQVVSRFKDEFFDWNEVRVSSIPEIQGVLAGVPDAERRAGAIRGFLRQLYGKTFGFTLEPLTKKPLKDAVKALQEYDALKSDYVLATVIQKSLGGHAIPVDRAVRRALARLGVADETSDPAALRSLLERAIPKNRGVEFHELMEDLCHDTCVAGPPDCPRCELRKICPTGQARLADDKKAARAALRAPKPAPARATAKPAATPHKPAPRPQPPVKPKTREKPAPPAASKKPAPKKRSKP